MALRQLIITQRMNTLRAERTALESAADELKNRRTAWEARESAAEAAFRELDENSTDEERAAFDAEAAEVESERIALETDETANAARASEIDAELGTLEAELDELNRRAKQTAKSVQKNMNSINNTERGNTTMSDYRMRVRELCANDEVRTFLGDFRAIKTRGVKNANYTIPTVMLPLIREATERSSKLLRHVNHQRVGGEGTQNVLAGVPEAIWTDTVGKLNEVEFEFNQIQTGGSKLGAYVAVPNAYLEDSDENLAGIVIDYLGQANGFGLDKAILYGTGTNMPVGIMTRLGANSQPAWWQTKMPTFTDLSTKNIGKLSAASVTGIKLFQEMMAVLGMAKEKYTGGNGDKFWAMSEDTYIALQSALLSINASGAIVTGAARTLPVIGGTVEFLDFIPSGTIIGGYGTQYLLAERAGIRIGESEHAMFIEDNTVFKATSRWDGIPVSGEGFAAFSINTTAVTTTSTFAEDKANKTE